MRSLCLCGAACWAIRRALRGDLFQAELKEFAFKPDLFEVRVFVESVLKHIDSLPDEFVDPCWVCTIAKTTRVGEDLVNLLDIVRKGNFVSTVIGDWRLEEFYEGLVDLEYFVYGEAVCASHIGTEERPDRFAVRQAWGDRLKAYRAQFEVFHALACEKHRDADRPDYDQLCAFW
jgi:hypothetical protein